MTTAPLGSVRTPVSFAIEVSVDCAWSVFPGNSRHTTANGKMQSNRIFMVSPSPSRAGVEGCPVAARGRISPRQLSGLRLRRSPGLAVSAARPSHSVANSRGSRVNERNSGPRPKNPALQSRGGDGFSPSSRARSLGLSGAALRAGEFSRLGAPRKHHCGRKLKSL
jgi:hypothetical protein